MIRHLIAGTAAALAVAVSAPGVLGRPDLTEQAAAAGEAQRAAAAAAHPVPVRRASPVASPAAPGAPVATMRIPRFGPDWEWVAFEGVTDDVLANGPGHFPGTALPGAGGNSAWAAHRAGHGDPFLDFDRLRPGDVVTLSQSGTTWTYVITTRPRIIDVTDVWVLDPLPGRMLTLTTCWPRYGSERRMYVRARLREG